jgi:hypothetical protein
LLCDASVGIEATKGAVALLEDATTFFDEWLDVVDEFFFVKFVAGCTISLLDILFGC